MGVLKGGKIFYTSTGTLLCVHLKVLRNDIYGCNVCAVYD